MLTLGAAGNRTSVTELSGRSLQYGYDDVYRLTSETIAGATSQNGTIGYTYDPVGNRQQITSTVQMIPSSGTLFYDANDRTATDNYDNNGNTISSGGVANIYDFENHMVQHGAVTIVYDGDGNRVSETAGGTTTSCLVDTLNPTGYAQVVDELQSGSVTRSYTLGLERISQRQVASSQQLSFYGFDGHGSVRYLTDTTGAVTDTYDYDAFGNLLSSTGTTPNNYRFAGEQWDPNLGLYYNRARYLDVRSGRFWSMDTYEGDPKSPTSLHKYLFAAADAVNRIDPGGNDFDLATTAAVATIGTIAANIGISVLALTSASSRVSPPDAFVGSVRVNLNGTSYGLTIGGGFDFYYDLHTLQLKVALAGEFGSAPLAIFKSQRVITYGGTAGLAWGSTSELSGFALSAAWPLRAFNTLAGVFGGTKEPFASLQRLSYLTNRTSIRDWAAVFVFSPSGAAAFEAGPRSNAFSAVAGYSSSYIPVQELLRDLGNAGQGLSDEIQKVKDLLPGANGSIEDLDTIIERLNQG